MASRPSTDERRGGGRPIALGGLALVVALAAAYLSDCIPGLGLGGSGGAPASESKAEPKTESKAEPAKAEPGPSKGARLSLVVEGEQCRHEGAEPKPCDTLCAELDRKDADSIIVEVDASGGRHGAVEALRTCLREAGFSDVRVRSE